MTTADCAASRLAAPMAEIDSPRLHLDREPLFSTLAWGQFKPDEMRIGLAWSAVSAAA